MCTERYFVSRLVVPVERRVDPHLPPGRGGLGTRTVALHCSPGTSSMRVRICDLRIRGQLDAVQASLQLFARHIDAHCRRRSCRSLPDREGCVPLHVLRRQRGTREHQAPTTTTAARTSRITSRTHTRVNRHEGTARCPWPRPRAFGDAGRPPNSAEHDHDDHDEPRAGSEAIGRETEHERGENRDRETRADGQQRELRQ